MTVERYFSIDEASRALLLVRPVVEDIIVCGRKLLDKTERSIDEDNKLKLEFREYLTELEDIGCIYNDWQFETGIVEFPAKVKDEDVLLSWSMQDSTIEYYYLPHENFNDRRKLPDLSPEQELTLS